MHVNFCTWMEFGPESATFTVEMNAHLKLLCHWNWIRCLHNSMSPLSEKTELLLPWQSSGVLFPTSVCVFTVCGQPFLSPVSCQNVMSHGFMLIYYWVLVFTIKKALKLSSDLYFVGLCKNKSLKSLWLFIWDEKDVSNLQLYQKLDACELSLGKNKSGIK
jgi:hypothetical protein